VLLSSSIEPFAQVAKLFAADGETNDYYGTSVSISGDTMVVGSPYAVINGNAATGAAYVYTVAGSNVTLDGKLTASDGTGSDFFGFSVSISGNTIAVGAYGCRINYNFEQGAAYVYTEPAGGWTTMTQTAKLTAFDGTASAQFGSSISVSGNTIAVGAPYALVGTGSVQSGAAYVYTKPANGWATTSVCSKLVASDGATNDQLGSKIGISGNTVVATAAAAAVNSNADQGAAYVYTQPAGGWANMTQTAKLVAYDGAAGDYFGWFGAISGNTIAVGSPYATVSGDTDAGAAYVFTESGSSWANTPTVQKLTAAAPLAGTKFGVSTFVSGSTMMIGADWEAENGTYRQGAAYLFTDSASGWAQTVKFTAADGAAGDNLGWSVAISGDTVIASAARTTIAGNLNQGATYVFMASFATLSGGELTISGTDGSDTLTLTQSGTYLDVALNNIPAAPVLLSGVTSVLVEGSAGNDTITIGTGWPVSTVQGGQGIDALVIAGGDNVTFTDPVAGDSSAGLIVQGTGTVTVAAQNTPGAASLNYALGTVTVAAGAELALARSDSLTDQTVFDASNLSVAGTLDIANNTLLANETNVPVSQIAAWVQAGSIMSSLVTGPNSQASRAVGYGDWNEDPLSVVAGDVEAKYVPVGDTNLDGKVDIADIGRAINNLGLSPGYYGGDILNQGLVNLTDISAVVNDLGGSLSASGNGGAGANAAVSASGAAAVAIPATPPIEPTAPWFSQTPIQADWLAAEISDFC